MTDTPDPKKNQPPAVTGGTATRACDLPLKATSPPGGEVSAPTPAQPKKPGLKWNAEHWGDDPGSLAGWYPSYCKAVDRLPEAGDVDGLRTFWDFDHRVDQAIVGDAWDMIGQDSAYYLLCRDLSRQGRPWWKWSEFNRQYIRYLDECIEREQAADELAKREAARDERKSRAGRKPSHASNDALKIQFGLGMSSRHAYRIVMEGTDDRETQGRLAAIFAADPTRCYRAAWARKTGKWGRGGPRDCFRAYITEQVAAFEAGDAVDALAAAYRDTALPVAFDDLPGFLKALANAGNPISPADAVTIWTAYEVWLLAR